MKLHVTLHYRETDGEIWGRLLEKETCWIIEGNVLRSIHTIRSSITVPILDSVLEVRGLLCVLRDVCMESQKEVVEGFILDLQDEIRFCRRNMYSDKDMQKHLLDKFGKKPQLTYLPAPASWAW
ncbi:hypothetical protein BAE30_00045 [Acidithiobacillus caldus]|uniref:Uncharacterized protein n=1 Tax=Acidithiobacillus caldus TaxID=33059 RepID=A0A1E7Z4R4_9PROT|nr:hypothetical protein BAE30_00045 [Acidithiobacillus caldus]